MMSEVKLRQPTPAVGNPDFRFLRQLLRGASTFIPGLNRSASPGGDSQSARYCYAVWLRHLVLADQSGLNTDPQVVAELGPGNSLGIGLAALICGARRCYALDVVQHTELSRNVAVFDELCELFAQRSAIPSADEFPAMKPVLEHYEFPHHILNDARLQQAMNPARLADIRRALQQPTAGSPIQYQAPWDDPSVIQPNCVDMIFSQAVLEHVDDLAATYAAMDRWLKPDGFMSHQIDFKCHGWARQWNGHWCYSDTVWKLLRGRQTFAINREPYSTHIRALTRIGLQPCYQQLAVTESQITQARVSRRFQRMNEEDLSTSGLFVLAQHPAQTD